MPANDRPVDGPATTSPGRSGDADGAPPVAAMSYEQARDELVQVVARLEAGGETLEGSLALWERGEALAARCQEWLDGARERLEAARRAESEAGPGATPRPGAGDVGERPDEETR